jgi:hypothetical protein
VAVSSIGTANSGHGLLGTITGNNATGTLTVSGGSSFATAQQSGINVSSSINTTAKLNVDVQNSTFTNNQGPQVAVNFGGNGSGSTVQVSNNTFTGTAPGVSVSSASTSTVQARVNSNSIDSQNGSNRGVGFILEGVGGLIAESNSNTITKGGSVGIFASNQLSQGSSRLDITANSNSITQSATNTNALHGIQIQHLMAGQTVTICANVQSNTIANANPSAFGGIRMRQFLGSTLYIQGVTPGATALVAATYLNNSNTSVTPSSSVSFASGSTALTLTCSIPSF